MRKAKTTWWRKRARKFTPYLTLSFHFVSLSENRDYPPDTRLAAQYSVHSLLRILFFINVRGWIFLLSGAAPYYPPAFSPITTLTVDLLFSIWFNTEAASRCYSLCPFPAGRLTLLGGPPYLWSICLGCARFPVVYLLVPNTQLKPSPNRASCFIAIVINHCCFTVNLLTRLDRIFFLGH